MNKIEKLIQEHERVWFYLKDAETKAQFVRDATALGCIYLNGNHLDIHNCYHIMAVHSDRRLAQVKIFVWNASFQTTNFTPFPLRVDYAKLVSGEEDWICKESEFIPIG